MKGLHGVLLMALLGVCGSAFSQDTTPERPQDYAWGAELELPEASPWYRVDLPSGVYARSVWPDLRDVRVFNHDGERVPFTLATRHIEAAEPEAIPLRLFPLAAKEEESGVVQLRSPDGVDIRIEGRRVNSVGQSYLLALPETMPERFALTQLGLTWSKPAERWQGKVTLFYSDDLRRWTLLQEDAPLMELTSGSDRLKIDTIPVNRRLTARYLLMVFDAPRLPVTITQATATLGREETSLEQVTLVSEGQSVSSTEALYQWTQPQPLRSLSVELAEEGVLPVDIAWRSAQNEPWQPLRKEVLWRRDGQSQAQMTLPGAVVQAVRITTLDAHLPAALPKVVGSRDRQVLVFNTQGKKPFMLAWGNKAAQPAAVSLDGLIPEALREQVDPAALPEAQVNAAVTLGGEARLSATSQAERQGLWKTVLVWGALLLGVAGLVWMGLGVWRDVKSR